MASKNKPKSLTKSQVATEVAAKSGLSKKDVGAAFDALAEVLAKELKSGRPMTLFGLVKVTTPTKLPRNRAPAGTRSPARRLPLRQSQLAKL